MADANLAGAVGNPFRGHGSYGPRVLFLALPKIKRDGARLLSSSSDKPLFLGSMLCVLFLGDLTEYLHYRVESRLGGPFPTGPFRSEGIRKKYCELYGPTDPYHLLYRALSWAIPLLGLAWGLPWFLSLRR